MVGVYLKADVHATGVSVLVSDSYGHSYERGIDVACFHYSLVYACCCGIGRVTGCDHLILDCREVCDVVGDGSHHRLKSRLHPFTC